MGFASLNPSYAGYDLKTAEGSMGPRLRAVRSVTHA